MTHVQSFWIYVAAIAGALLLIVGIVGLVEALIDKRGWRTQACVAALGLVAFLGAGHTKASMRDAARAPACRAVEVTP